jgi:hypothetical protein
VTMGREENSAALIFAVKREKRGRSSNRDKTDDQPRNPILHSCINDEVKIVVHPTTTRRSSSSKKIFGIGGVYAFKAINLND